MKNKLRGFDENMPGNCILCEKPLGPIRYIHKIPIFDPSSNPGTMDLASYINQYVHQECWHLWSNRDVIAKACVDQKNDEYGDAERIIEERPLSAWGYFNSDIAFSHGSLFLPRSSLLFDNIMGIDVKECEIKGRTSNLCQFINIIKSNELNPGFSATTDFEEEIPDLTIKCYDFFNEYSVEVELSSKHEYGINCICILLKDDIELVRRSILTKHSKMVIGT